MFCQDQLRNYHESNSGRSFTITNTDLLANIGFNLVANSKVLSNVKPNPNANEILIRTEVVRVGITVCLKLEKTKQ